MSAPPSVPRKTRDCLAQLRLSPWGPGQVESRTRPLTPKRVGLQVCLDPMSTLRSEGLAMHSWSCYLLPAVAELLSHWEPWRLRLSSGDTSELCFAGSES